MTILFLHGWHSAPGGLKPSYLVQKGATVINPALPDEDFEAAVQIAQQCFDEYKPNCVVGSSRGGAVAMNIKIGDTPLVLLCPAWKYWGTQDRVGSKTHILHSRNDEVIPWQDTMELIANSAPDTPILVETGSDHRLADPESLERMWLASQGELLRTI